MLNTNGLFSSILLYGFGASGVFFAIQSVVPNVNEPTGQVAAIGSFIFALLTAIFRQGNVIKNIDENMQKVQKSMSEQVEILTKTLKTSQENSETLIKLIRQLNENEQKHIEMMESERKRVAPILFKKT